MALFRFDDANNLYQQVGYALGNSVRNSEFYFYGGNDRLELLRDDDLAGLGRSGIADMGGDKDVVIVGSNSSGKYFLGDGDDFFEAAGIEDSLDRITVRGGVGNDLVMTRSDQSVFNGDEGDDIVVTTGAKNYVEGGAGVDVYSLELAAKGANIDMGANNQVQFNGAQYIEPPGKTFSKYSASSEAFVNIENIRGTNFGDRIFGDRNSNQLEGLDGDDTIDAWEGDDIVSGGPGYNVLLGGAGFDTLVIEGQVIRKLRVGPDSIAIEGSVNGQAFVHDAAEFEQILHNGVLASVAFFLDESSDNDITAVRFVAYDLPALRSDFLALTTAANPDLPVIGLSVSPASVSEDGVANLVYTFTRNGPSSSVLTVNYTVGGTARQVAVDNDPADYIILGSTSNAASRSVRFEPGTESATVTVTVDPTADTQIEADETIALTLASGNGYTIGTTEAVIGEIQDASVTVTAEIPWTASGSRYTVNTADATSVIANLQGSPDLIEIQAPVSATLNAVSTATWGSTYFACNVGSMTRAGTGERILLNGIGKYSFVATAISAATTTIVLEQGKNTAFSLHDAFTAFYQGLPLRDDSTGRPSAARLLDIDTIRMGSAGGTSIVDLTSKDYITTAISVHGADRGRSIFWGTDADDSFTSGGAESLVYGGAGGNRFQLAAGVDTLQYRSGVGAQDLISNFDPVNDKLQFWLGRNEAYSEPTFLTTAAGTTVTWAGNALTFLGIPDLSRDNLRISQHTALI